MGSASFVLAALNTAAFLLCVGFLAYVVLIIVPYMRHRRSTPGDAAAFAWHLVIPALDEALVIEATVLELHRSFPDAELWVIDDASVDDTPHILDRLAAVVPTLHVISRRPPEARLGKGPALNAAYGAINEWIGPRRAADRIIVGVIDADARLDPAGLDLVSGPEFFGDPTVGAVQIQVRVTDHLDDPDGPLAGVRHDPMLIRLQDLEFAGPIAGMQLLRRKAGSVGMGGNGQFSRLSVLDHIAAEHGTPWHGALLEDFELGLHVLLAGYRTEYCDDAWVAQEGLRSLRPLLRQRSRWSQGSMQCMRYLWPVLRSARISTQGALEIAYFLFLPWLQLVGGLVYAAVSGVAVYYLATDQHGVLGWLRNGAWGILPLFVLFGLAPFVVWGPLHRRRNAPDLSHRQVLTTSAVNIAYTYFHHVAVWWAFLRLVSARHDWKKTDRRAPRSARSPAPVTPAAASRRVPVPVPALVPVAAAGTFSSTPSPTRLRTTGRFVHTNDPRTTPPPPWKEP